MTFDEEVLRAEIEFEFEGLATSTYGLNEKKGFTIDTYPVFAALTYESRKAARLRYQAKLAKDPARLALHKAKQAEHNAKRDKKRKEKAERCKSA